MSGRCPFVCLTCKRGSFVCKATRKKKRIMNMSDCDGDYVECMVYQVRMGTAVEHYEV